MLVFLTLYSRICIKLCNLKSIFKTIQFLYSCELTHLYKNCQIYRLEKLYVRYTLMYMVEVESY